MRPASRLSLSAATRSWWPAWRRLPGTNIIVDCFGRSCAAVGPNRTWVLTHFHADHYMGLTRGFKQGIIICTPITAALVRLKLRVAPERLAVLDLGQELNVEGEWVVRAYGQIVTVWHLSKAVWACCAQHIQSGVVLGLEMAAEARRVFVIWEDC